MALDLGDVVPLAVTVTDATGTATNASSVTLTITLPDGTTVTPSVANPPAVTGVYTCDYPTVQAGRHVARWTSSGPQAAYVDAFDVSPAEPGYLISLADAKEQLKITSSTSDEEVRRYLGATTVVVEDHVGQAVVRRTFSEEHTANCGAFVLTRNPVISLVSVALVDGTFTWDVSTLHVSPAGVVTSPLGISPHGHLAATYIAGMAIVPDNYALAAAIILQHLWDTKRGTRGGPRPGGLDDSLGVVGAGFAIPNRALELLGGGMPGIA